MNVLIVDDHPMMRKGMRQLIEMQEGLEVVAETGSGEEALAVVATHQPDIILMDLNMKGVPWCYSELPIKGHCPSPGLQVQHLPGPRPACVTVVHGGSSTRNRFRLPRTAARFQKFKHCPACALHAG